MDTQRGSCQSVTVVGIALVVLGVTAVGWAQPAAPPPKPAVATAKVAVSMGADGNDTVEATYTVQNTAGLKGGVVEHALARRPGAEVGEIAAAGAATGPPELERREGISILRVTVSGEPATYTLRYPVRRAAGAFAVPLLVPRIPVARSAPNVTIETTLPPGSRPDGEWFPSVERVETREGRTVLVHRVINIPSVTIAEYGTGRVVTARWWIGAVALVFLGLVVVWWFAHAMPQRRPAGGAAR
jgi:hypothetical protein